LPDRSACRTCLDTWTRAQSSASSLHFICVHVDEERIEQHRLAQSEKRNEHQKESQGSVEVEPCFLPMGPKPFKFSARAAPGRAETQPASQRQQNKYRVRGQFPAFRPQHAWPKHYLFVLVDRRACIHGPQSRPCSGLPSCAEMKKQKLRLERETESDRRALRTGVELDLFIYYDDL
jgi:hypothetical protein